MTPTKECRWIEVWLWKEILGRHRSVLDCVKPQQKMLTKEGEVWVDVSMSKLPDNKFIINWYE